MWTPEQLEQFAHENLGGRKIVVVSNREPYMHDREQGIVKWVKPPGGLVGALDPILRSVRGTWVAHGAGSADRATADKEGRLQVPPDDPQYTLRRVWLSKNEEAGYYYGMSNEALWPLCHICYVRPVFRESDWLMYQNVNRKFADVVIEEIDDAPALVLVQDYHLSLLPRLLRIARPDIGIGMFWHIPWPNSDVFRTCPWRKEILEGILGNDVIGFHVQNNCMKFLDCVDAELQARTDREHQCVHHGDFVTYVAPFPIGTDAQAIAEDVASPRVLAEKERLAKMLAPSTTFVAVGVDRVDYTKGIPERLKVIDHFLIENPAWREKFQYLGIGAPSRMHIQTYQNLTDEIKDLIEDINWRHGTDNWQPIVFLNEPAGSATVHALYALGNACLVTSLHDGMNLVAKEYAAARVDGDGILILSRFTGAANDLPEAVLVNPHDVVGTAKALAVAVEMPEAERRSRMERIRAQVLDRNVFHWAQRLFAATMRRADALTPLQVS